MANALDVRGGKRSAGKDVSIRIPVFTKIDKSLAGEAGKMTGCRHRGRQAMAGRQLDAKSNVSIKHEDRTGLNTPSDIDADVLGLIPVPRPEPSNRTPDRAAVAAGPVGIPRASSSSRSPRRCEDRPTGAELSPPQPGGWFLHEIQIARPAFRTS